jgi:glycosyltransferase involved in cell wall biosynthesis
VSRRPRVLTWHVHGSYLYYLAHADVELLLPVGRADVAGYLGRRPNFPWPDNVHEVDVDGLTRTPFDVVLFQTRRNYCEDQFEILSERQRRLPRVYLEHDPPLDHPAATRHVVDDPDVLLVHVTHFNDLMWDAGRTPTRVIRHGVVVPDDARYTGELRRGVTVVNNLYRRGRRTGPDVFDRARGRVPLDLFGMAFEDGEGAGELPLAELPYALGRYRFFFNPIRYTSLGLALCEAMMVGLPIVALATTEQTVVVENGVSGFVDTDVDVLIERMLELSSDPRLAQELSAGARERARELFSIERFAAEWTATFAEAAGLADARTERVA